MNSNLTPEQRKQRTENIAKVIGLLAVCFILGTTTIATTIFTGIGVLGALIFTGAGLFTVWKFVPYFALKIGNAHLKAIKSEAMRNPVETLQTQLVKQRNALAEFKEQIRIFAGQVLSFKDKVDQYVREGLEDAQVYVEQLGKMKKLLALRQEKCQQAEQGINEFEESIERTERKWKMALAAQAMNEAAGEIAGDVFDKICIETSVNAVQDKLNQSMADLEIALMDEENKKKITGKIPTRIQNLEVDSTVQTQVVR